MKQINPDKTKQFTHILEIRSVLKLEKRRLLFTLLSKKHKRTRCALFGCKKFVKICNLFKKYSAPEEYM